MSRVAHHPIRRSPQRSRRRRSALASAGASYVAAYSSAVLGFLAIFEPTGPAALAALAAAVLFAAVSTLLVVTSPREAPRLA